MDYNASLRLFLDGVKKDFPFDAAAVRILDPLDYISFAAHNDLSASFIEDEGLISINDCVCGRVIQLDPKNGLPYFTWRGSFWSNSLSEDVAWGLKNIGINPRGRCLREGYKTLLITPIRTGNVRGEFIPGLQKRKSAYGKGCESY